MMRSVPRDAQQPFGASRFAKPARPELSVVVPAFYEAESVAPLAQAMVDPLQGTGTVFELIIVDGGSADDTWAHLNAVAERDPRNLAVGLSRNFGRQSALLAGLSLARGRAIVSVDADLQHPPAVTPEMPAAWRAGVAVGRTVRRAVGVVSPFKRVTSPDIYRLFSDLTGIPLSEGRRTSASVTGA